MNILLIGECFSKNLGDGVICNTVENIFKRNIEEDINIYKLDLSGWLDYDKPAEGVTKYNFIVNTITSMKLFKIHRNSIYRAQSVLHNFEKYNKINFDIAVFAGGQMFMDYFSIPIYCLVKKLEKRKIPVAFNACGVGKNNSRLNQFFLRKAINNKVVKYISLRDNIALFKELYLRRDDIKIYEVLDPALALGKYTQITNRTVNKIGLGVMSLGVVCNNGVNINLEESLILWSNIIRKLDSMGLEWEIFTNGAPEDYRFAENLVDILGYDKNKVLAPIVATPDELIEVIKQYNGIISFRLHSHIVASSLGIPSIGFVWDKKVKEFGQKINCSENFIDLNNKNFKEIALNRIENFNLIRKDNTEMIAQSEKDTMQVIKNILNVKMKEGFIYE